MLTVVKAQDRQCLSIPRPFLKSVLIHSFFYRTTLLWFLYSRENHHIHRRWINLFQFSLILISWKLNFMSTIFIQAVPENKKMSKAQLESTTDCSAFFYYTEEALSSPPRGTAIPVLSLFQLRNRTANDCSFTIVATKGNSFLQ